MRRRIVLCVFAGAAVLASSVVAAGALEWRNYVRDVNRARYDASVEQVYEGTLGCKGHVVDGLMYFVLRISGNTLEVQLGPEEFVEHSGFKFKIGEMVTVVGMPLVWRGRDIIVARQVSSMRSILILRDREGQPMWGVEKPILADPESVLFHLSERIKP